MKISLNDVKCIRFYTAIFFLLLTVFGLVSCQCAGTVLQLTANETFQIFTSDNYPSNYPNDAQCEWLIEAVNSSHILRLQVTDCGIEYHSDCVYDFAEVFDGHNTSYTSLGKFCGTDTPTYVSSGHQMTVTFRSDYSLASKGFLARYRSGATETLPGEEEESSTSVDIVTVLAGAIGAVALLVVILTIIFVYIQSRKAKRHREQLARQGLVARTSSGSRVHPFEFDNRRGLIGPPPPPAYGDIYSTPVSPPPAYSEVDPNPQGTVTLPGTPDVTVPDSTRSDNSRVNTSTVITADFNSNTHFSTTGVVRNLQTFRDTVLAHQQSPRQTNPQGTAVNTGVRRTASNAGALAAMQILRPSTYTTNNFINTPRTNNATNSVNERTGNANGVTNPSRLPTQTVDNSPRAIVHRGVNGEQARQNTVEVEVHRSRSALSSVSDLSEMTLSSGQRSASSQARFDEGR